MFDTLTIGRQPTTENIDANIIASSGRMTPLQKGLNLQDDDVARLGHCEDIAVDLEEVRRPHAFGKAFCVLHYDPRCEFCAVQPHA